MMLPRPQWTIRRIMLGIAGLAILFALPFPFGLLMGGLVASLVMNIGLSGLIMKAVDRNLASLPGRRRVRVLTASAALLDLACWLGIRYGHSLTGRYGMAPPLDWVAVLLPMFSLGAVGFILAMYAATSRCYAGETILESLVLALVLPTAAPFSLGLGFVWIFSIFDLISRAV